MAAEQADIHVYHLDVDCRNPFDQWQLPANGNFQGSTSGVLTQLVNQAALTITAVTNTKVYDGTTSAAAVPTVTGLQRATR